MDAGWRTQMRDGSGDNTTTAAEFLPERRTLPALKAAAAGCRGCPLWERGTQTVFGEGRTAAQIMLVGEQPGNDEDLAGAPFVGPAGRVLDDGLVRAGIDRKEAYVTNVVKHFKWEPRGKRRLHSKPNAREIEACLPWLEAEIELLRPRVIVCLGATAAKTLLGRQFRVTRDRGRLVESDLAEFVTATIHPSAILRMRTREQREEGMEQFVDDLRNAGTMLDGAS